MILFHVINGHLGAVAGDIFLSLKYLIAFIEPCSLFLNKNIFKPNIPL